VGASFRISGGIADGNYYNYNPSAAYDGVGSFLVAYYRDDLGPDQVFGRFVDTTGPVGSGEFSISTGDGGNSFAPAVFRTADGAYLVTYGNSYSGGGGKVSRVFARVVNSDESVGGLTEMYSQGGDYFHPGWRTAVGAPDS
jgi:hypothetical protein